MLIVLIGFFSGIISGLGIGGGTILIPALIFFASAEQHVAQSINLTAFLPIAIIAIIIHAKNKSIHYKLAFYLILSGVAGALIGSKVAVILSSTNLRKLFGFFLLFMGIYELFRKAK